VGFNCRAAPRSRTRMLRYAVVRVWQLPPQSLLSGGLALLPLAPISAVTEAELPGIIRQMEQRLSSRRARKQAPLVWGAAYILLGLRSSPALAAQRFRGVMSMKESSTYQAILEEGRGEGAVAEAKKLFASRGRPSVRPSGRSDSCNYRKHRRSGAIGGSGFAFGSGAELAGIAWPAGDEPAEQAPTVAVSRFPLRFDRVQERPRQRA
jgi:hypothetical protein